MFYENWNLHLLLVLPRVDHQKRDHFVTRHHEFHQATQSALLKDWCLSARDVVDREVDLES